MGAVDDQPLPLAHPGPSQLWLASVTAADLGDDESRCVLSTRRVKIASEAGKLIQASMSEVVPGARGIGVTVTRWASALLSIGLGRYEDALVAARQAGVYPQELGVASWGLTELIEAAARSGMTELAAVIAGSGAES